MANEKDQQQQRWIEALNAINGSSPASPPDVPDKSVHPSAEYEDQENPTHVNASEDLVAIAAPGPEAFLPKRNPSKVVAEQMRMKSLAYRRTIVPVLLTLGVLLPVLCLLWHQVDEDSP